MSFRPNRTFVVAWLTPLLVTLAALALPASGLAAGTGAISGTVSAQGGGGLANIEVCAWSRAGNEEDWGCEVSGVGGTYKIPNLPEGEYVVEFWPGPQNYVWQYYGGTQEFGTATPVVVTGGTTKTGVDAALVKGAQVKGRVTAAATGLSAPEVEVCAFPTTDGSYRCALTDSTGNYTIIGLREGSYHVFFYPEGNGMGLLAQVWNNHEVIETGDVLVLAAEAVQTGINAALRPGGAITGTVRLAATGAPLAGVRVCLVESAFLESLGCLTSPASGGYRFYGLRNEAYKIVFSAEANDIEDPEAKVDAFPTQWWNGQATFAAATPIPVTPPGTVSGIDGSLGPPPAKPVVPTTPPASPPPVSKQVPTKPKPKVLKCRKGFAKRKVRGKAKCVRLHKAAKHKRHHK
ncbi:MAG TPA: carboxypeptidase-like regulatory domain-containing protein [Solirubrobacterales bacterium]|nr:carboxypeptidase-like regulatory domain-containing protein [Solirubrobacterales bacterium]